MVAGKTGTSNDAVDAWFVGYTPELVGTIWLGFDKRTSIVPGGKAGELAAPIWGRVMARVAQRGRDWQIPAGVESRQMDDEGNVYANNCRRSELHPERAVVGQCKGCPAGGSQFQLRSFSRRSKVEGTESTH